MVSSGENPMAMPRCPVPSVSRPEPGTNEVFCIHWLNKYWLVFRKNNSRGKPQDQLPSIFPKDPYVLLSAPLGALINEKTLLRRRIKKLLYHEWPEEISQSLV